MGKASFEQKLTDRKRIKIKTVEGTEDLLFNYKCLLPSREEFLERIDDYLSQKQAYLTEVNKINEGRRFVSHSISGTLYKLK